MNNYTLVIRTVWDRKWVFTLMFLRLMWEMGKPTEVITLQFDRINKRKKPTITFCDELKKNFIGADWQANAEE